MIKYGTFTQIWGYDQRVIGEKPKSTIKVWFLKSPEILTLLTGKAC